jgi:hypothetical protein
MGRKAIEKGKEFRPRLHDGLPVVTRVGKFLIVHCNGEEQAEKYEKQALYIRPDRTKGPVRIT